ncbi:MAG: hypothetical protein J5I90_11010 [Caldilineales bacterium]|nr:hypothetical protein [Caldilineales bacterium]
MSDHTITERNEASGNWLTKALAKMIVFAPWAWLLVFGLFVALVSLTFGAPPSYGQPDPKDAGLASILYIPTIVLMLWTLASVPAAIVLSVLGRISGQPSPFARRDWLVYGIGLALYALIAFSNVGGLMTWLAD